MTHISTKLLLNSAASLALSCAFSVTAYAAPNPDDSCRDGGTNNGSLQCGDDADAAADFSTAVGDGAIANSIASTALGRRAQAVNDIGTTAIGAYSGAFLENATALGFRSVADAVNATALGANT